MALDPTKVTKFSGPPGTGKSTTLLNVVDKLLTSGVAPEDVLFTTFTRAGADEARNRACARFNLPPGRFPYFKTIHSICYSLLPKREVMSWRDWREIGGQIGVYFSTAITPDEGVPRGHTKGDYLMSLWSLARVLQQHPKDLFDNRDKYLMGFEDMEYIELEHFIASVQAYKTSTAKIDFTDMLEEYLVRGPLISPRAAIIDEAQDLSPLQWQVIDKFCNGAAEIYVAGDDDQCIHAWNGASVGHFINLASDKYSVLPQSFRIPKLVHELATTVVDRISDRLPKVYQPREERGTLHRTNDLYGMDLTKDTWLLLGRNISTLSDYAEYCMEQGLLWVSQSVPGADPKVLEAIATWKLVQLGEPVNVGRLQNLYKFMSQADRITRGFKKRLDAVNPRDSLTHAQLVAHWGMLAPKHMRWPSALDMLEPTASAFLEAVDRREGLTAKARIEIGTIHSAKGKEADHVVLATDMSHKTYTSYETNPDAEHRVWYVGVTRARQSLTILDPKTDKFYPL